MLLYFFANLFSLASYLPYLLLVQIISYSKYHVKAFCSTASAVKFIPTNTISFTAENELIPFHKRAIQSFTGELIRMGYEEVSTFSPLPNADNAAEESESFTGVPDFANTRFL